MTWMPPVGTLAICRMAAIVPILFRWSARLVVLGGLQRQEQQAVARERAVHRLDRKRPGDRERLKREREDDGVTKREDGKLGRIVTGLFGHTSIQDTGGDGGEVTEVAEENG